MGDSRRIDLLRALALSSMPSLARRPAQRQNSSFVDTLERRRTVVSAFPAKSDEKEEGELSSDDEAERLATPLAALETSLSFAPRNAGLSLHAPSQGNLKDERHTSAATSAESVPHVGVSSAPVFSTSTRVSIVNKSQLLSAFTAQAPPLISSQTPEPGHNQSAVGLAGKRPKQNISKVISSGATFAPSSGNGALEFPGEAVSTAALHLNSTLPERSLSEASWSPNYEASMQASSLGGSAPSPVLFLAQASSAPSLTVECPVPPTAIPALRSDVSPVLVSVVAIGAPELASAASGKALAVSTTVVAGPDVPAGAGTAPPVSVVATPVLGGFGVRKEAEAFLASLRLPLPNPVTSGDEKEDAFLIKFDEDSDSDGENENHSNSTSKYPGGRSMQKGTTNGLGPMSMSVLPQSNPVMPNQNPSDLSAEIDRMKKQIAAMERTKSKTSALSVLGKSSRVVSADAARQIAPPAVESKAGLHLATTQARPALVDLESMRLRIAAKETELQQRRQRLALKGSESSKGMSDPKGTGAVAGSSVPPTLRSIQTYDGTAAHAINPVGKASSEKGMPGLKKDAHIRADGIPALALAGPDGANLAGFKKDAEQRGLDGPNNHQHLNDRLSNSTDVQVGSHVSEVLGRQSMTKGMKRSRPEGDNQEAVKVPKFDSTSLLEKRIAGEVFKEGGVAYDVSDPSKDGNHVLSSIRTSIVPKRKVGATQISSGKAVSGSQADVITPAGSEGTKKLKIDSGVLVDSGCDVREGLVSNSKQHAHRKGPHVAQTVSPCIDVIQVSPTLVGEKKYSASPNSDICCPSVPCSLGSLKTTTRAMSDMVDLSVSILDVEPVASLLSAPHPIATKTQGGLIAVQKKPEDVFTSSNGTQATCVSEHAEASRLQQAVCGGDISHVSPPSFQNGGTASVPQPGAKGRHDKEFARSTTVAFTERQPKALGPPNLTSTLSAVNNIVHTSLSWRPVNSVSLQGPTNLENPLEHSFQPGHSRIDNQHLNAEHVSFQRLLEEEELLDKQLEEVQQIRQKCELRERVARREYREAQHALRAANADCDSLNQRKEFLLSQIHAGESRHYSLKSYLDRPSLPFDGTRVTNDHSKDERPMSLVIAPNPLSVSRVAEGSLDRNVTGDKPFSGEVHESLSPLSSNRVDGAAAGFRDVQPDVSTEGGEGSPSRTWVERMPSGVTDYELPTQVIAEADCRGKLKDEGVVGQMGVQASFVSAESQKNLEVGIVVDVAATAGTQDFACCANDLNNGGTQNSQSADVKNPSLGVADLTATVQSVAVSSTHAPESRAVDLSAGTFLEDSVAVPQRSLSRSTVQCSNQCCNPCAINHLGIGCPEMGAVSAVYTENGRHPVATVNEVHILLDGKHVMSKDLEHKGTNQEYHDVEQTNAVTAQQDAQNVNLIRNHPLATVNEVHIVLDGKHVMSRDLEHKGSDQEYHDVEQINAVSAQQDAQNVDLIRSRPVATVNEGHIVLDGKYVMSRDLEHKGSDQEYHDVEQVNAVSAQQDAQNVDLIRSHPVATMNEGHIVLDGKHVMSRDLEHKGSDQEYHDVEQINAVTAQQDAQNVDLIRSHPVATVNEGHIVLDGKHVMSRDLEHKGSDSEYHDVEQINAVSAQQDAQNVDLIRSHPVATVNEGHIVLDGKHVMSRDLEHKGSDQEYHDVEQINTVTAQQDVQNVNLVRSAPDISDSAEDLESPEVQESVNTREGNVSLDEITQDDSSVNVPIGNYEDCHIGASTIQFDGDCCLKAGTQDLSPSISEECTGQVLPDRPSSLQEAVSAANETAAGEVSKSDGGYAREYPFQSEGVQTSPAREGADNSILEPMAEGPDDGLLSSTVPQQCSSHLLPFASDPLCKSENSYNGDSPKIEGSQWALLDMGHVPPVILADSAMDQIPSHLEEADILSLNELRVQGVSPQLPPSSGPADIPIVLELEMQQSKYLGTPEEIPGVHVVADVEALTGASQSKKSSESEPESHLLNLQEDFEGGGLNEENEGVSAAGSVDFVSGNCSAEQSPGTSDQVCHIDALNLTDHYSQPLCEERDPPGNSSVVSIQLNVARSLSDSSRQQGCADCLEEQQHCTSEVQQQPTLTVSVDDSSTFELVSRGLDPENEDIVQDGDDDLCRSEDVETMTDNSETPSQSEVQSQERGLGMAVDTEDQQQDDLNVEVSESGEPKLDNTEKKESKGAEVEVFRKALLDGNVFERRSSGGDVVDAMNSQKPNRDEVSKQTLPQFQSYRLDQLLDMVEVRGPELSLGVALGQEDLQGSNPMTSSEVADAVQQFTSTMESNGIMSESTEQAQLSKDKEATVKSLGFMAEHWVPSAVSLAVLSCIPRVEVTPSERGSVHDLEMNAERDSRTACGASVVPLRYESPLTVFRSYRICPQFSSALHLSYSSSTWSHAINPFKPLCKFEHRGKCNNDDCPWQHADDYKLSSSQLEFQLQNYADSSTLNSDDHDIAVTISDKGAELAMETISLPTLDSSVTAIISKAQLAGRAGLLPKSLGQSSLFPKWNDSEAIVPSYRIGSYTLKAEDPSRMCLLSYSLQLDRRVDRGHSFLLSPSIHRPLPLDMPCLLDASESLSLLSETPAHRPGSPHWRYMGDIQEKLMSTKDGSALQEFMDEETWLELALRHIDFDISTENYKARDQALFYLSRALESKPSSVTLWVVYSCLFHMRKDNTEQDDMFRHAVQYNQGSYELWVLYINSRSDVQSRLGAYEKAIVALAAEGTKLQLDREELSACILDIGLQMLYCWCVSGCLQDSLKWVDDLIFEASSQHHLKPHGGSTTALLSKLTQHDACVLWIACTYLLACRQLPTCIITRLGCKQELPDGLDWEKHAKVDEVSHKGVIKALSTAASQGLGCLSLESTQAVGDEDNLSRQVLGVNYVQCLALYEGLDNAACLGQKLMSLHPTSVELIVICARINERLRGPSTGLHVFEEALLRWPSNSSGVQHLWNQYTGHALLWGGKDLAKTVLLKCTSTKKLHSSDEVQVLPWRSVPVQVPISTVNLEKMEGTDWEGNSEEGWSHLREYFVALASMTRKIDCGTISNYQLSQLEDSVFSLINLAVVEALTGNIAASQSAINRALKTAISHKDLRQCWRELAAFQQVFCAKFVGWEDSDMLEQSMLSLLDRCKTDSHILSQLRPLSQKAFQNFKKPLVRQFFDDLVGPPPLDHSILNSILLTLYGPQLLPSDSHALKEVFHFAEGILEAIPGNVPLASCLCKIVGQNSRALKQMYMSAAIWACALLTSSLHQSCPVAPEVYWVEAGLLLRELGEEKSLQEFYGHALGKYPFSAALHHGLKEVQDWLQSSDTFAQGTKYTGLNLVAAEPMQVGVQC